MKKTLVAVFAVILTLGIFAEEAEAARFGGGRSFGMKRQAVTPKPASPAQAAPAPTNPASAAGAATTPKRNWMGPIAGLAAGRAHGPCAGRREAARARRDVRRRRFVP